MNASTDRRRRFEPNARASSAVSAFFVHELEHEASRVVLPRPEIQLVVRIGSMAKDGLDVYAFGARQHAHRKRLRGGQRSIVARLRLGASEAVLGVPATILAGRIVALEDLWGEAAVRRLAEKLAATRVDTEAVAILETAIAERFASASLRRDPVGLAGLALDAAERLARANVTAVADELGMSERHLRRIFRETVGVGPKAFAKLARFHRAVRAAREDDRASWAAIAAASGYYDQAHLIAEFRGIAGVTPRALLGELGPQAFP